MTAHQPCCCTTPCHLCDKCANAANPSSAGGAPCCFALTIDGIAAGYPTNCYCEYCPNFNGDYVVSQNPPFEGYTCCWTGTLCTEDNANTMRHCLPVDLFAAGFNLANMLDRLTLCLQQDGITNKYYFRLGLTSQTGAGIIWRSAMMDNKPDCTALADPITLNFYGYQSWGGTSIYYKCDASASTVVLHPNNVSTFAECPDRGSTCGSPHGCVYCRDLARPVSFTINAGGLGTFEVSPDASNSCHYSYSGSCTVGLSISWSSGTFLADGCYLSVGITCGGCTYSYNWYQFDDLDCVICDCSSIGTVTINCSGASGGCFCATHPSISVTANY